VALTDPAIDTVPLATKAKMPPVVLFQAVAVILLPAPMVTSVN
jgi:hypothetical protein